MQRVSCRSLLSQMGMALDHWTTGRSGRVVGSMTPVPRPCCFSQVLLGGPSYLPGTVVKRSQEEPKCVTQMHEWKPEGLPLAKVGPQYTQE